MRRWWVVFGVVVALTAVALVAVNLWAHAYLRSEAFRRLVAERTGAALGGEANYAPFSWSGPSVFSAELDVQGGEALRDMEAREIRAEVDWKAVLRGAWRIERIQATRLDVTLAPTTGADLSSPPAAPARRGWLPTRFELDRMDVGEANVSLGDRLRVAGVALTIRPEGSGWLLDGRGGRLRLAPDQPEFAIQNVRLRRQQGVVYLTEATLRLGASGILSGSGEFGSQIELRTEWTGVDARDVLRGAWRERLVGALAGTAITRGPAGRKLVTSGRFVLTEGRLEGAPLQREIARFTRSPQFERMPLREVSGDFETDGATTAVRNFLAESPGLLRVEGQCRVGADGALTGEFRVGVTASTLQWLPGSQERVFVAAANGYLWTTLRVGGTVEQPTEDLSARLARAMGEQAVQTGVEVLKSAPDTAVDAVREAVDLLTPLIP